MKTLGEKIRSEYSFCATAETIPESRVESCKYRGADPHQGKGGPGCGETKMDEM
jgi:hypothetical protein